MLPNSYHTNPPALVIMVVAPGRINHHFPFSFLDHRWEKTEISVVRGRHTSIRGGKVKADDEINKEGRNVVIAGVICIDVEILMTWRPAASPGKWMI